MDKIRIGRLKQISSGFSKADSKAIVKSLKHPVKKAVFTGVSLTNLLQKDH